MSDGIICNKYHVKRVKLQDSDVLEYFDCNYHHFIQGACCHRGKIYSLEGFGGSSDNPPGIRVIDLNSKKEISFEKFEDYGINTEPEMIDFDNNTCYYSDHHGNMYNLYFTE